MKTISTLVAVLALSLSLTTAIFAEDWEAVCHEELKTADIPPEVTQEQLDTYCSCYAGAIDGDTALEEEARILIALPRDERAGQVSEALETQEKSCQEEALGGLSS